MPIPQNFPGQELSGEKADLELAKKNWQLFFQDEQLANLISIALKNNQEINILDQEINIANNEVMARQGSYIPRLGLSAGYEYEKSSKFTSEGKMEESAAVPEKLGNRQLGFTASWEVDIWKKLRNAAKSSYYQYLASIEGRNFAITGLIAEVANNYYELMALDNQLEIVEQFIVNLKQAREVAALQQIAGRTTSLSVRRFDAEVQKNEGRKYKIQQEIIVTENNLNQLLGRLPQPILRDSKKFQEIKMADISSGIPALLLDNRPDVKQAVLKLEAAKLNVKAVKAEFYPALSIDSAIGYKAFNSRHLFDTPESLLYNVAGNFTVPLLNRRAIKADYFSSNNKQIQAIYNYEQVFIKAFSEVSNQLAAVKNSQEIYNAKLQQSSALADSFEISNILFKAARVDYLESLLTRRDYLEAKIELMEAKQQQLAAYVNLYRSLGGGWRHSDSDQKSAVDIQ